MEGYGDWVEGNPRLIRTKKSEIIQLCKLVQVDGQARCVTSAILTPAALGERLADFPLQVRTQRSDMVCCSIIRDLRAHNLEEGVVTSWTEAKRGPFI